MTEWLTHTYTEISKHFTSRKNSMMNDYMLISTGSQFSFHWYSSFSPFPTDYFETNFRQQIILFHKYFLSCLKMWILVIFILSQIFIFHQLKKNNLINLFIYFWLCWAFLDAWSFSLVVASGGYSLAAVRGLLIATASLVAEHRLCGTRASITEAPELSSCGSHLIEWSGPPVSHRTWAWEDRTVGSPLHPCSLPLPPAQ